MRWQSRYFHNFFFSPATSTTSGSGFVFFFFALSDPSSFDTMGVVMIKKQVNMWLDT